MNHENPNGPQVDFASSFLKPHATDAKLALTLNLTTRLLIGLPAILRLNNRELFWYEKWNVGEHAKHGQNIYSNHSSGHQHKNTMIKNDAVEIRT